MPSVKHDSFHIILSPRECPDASKLVAWIHSKPNTKYVVAYEYGKNGHKHIDAFVLFEDLYRQDNLRRDILALYKNVIPEDEKRNCKVIINTADPNPMYGWGYALKEGNETYSNLTIDEQEQSLEYYHTQCDRVNRLIKLNKNKHLSIDEIVDGLAGYATEYLSERKTVYNDVSHHFLIDEYLLTLCHSKAIKFTTYQKINKEKLREFLDLTLREHLLTAPASLSINFHESENNPLI